MNNRSRLLAGCASVLLFLFGIGSQAQLPAVTPRDCVEVRYIAGVWMSASGAQVAYLVKTANLAQNINEYKLFVKRLDDRSSASGQFVLKGIDISDVHWMDHDRRIALLMSIGGIKKIVMVSPADRRYVVVPTRKTSIDSFSVDARGNTLAFITADESVAKHDASERTKDQTARGYRIDFEAPVTHKGENKLLYLLHRGLDGKWSEAHPISINNPFTRDRETQLSNAQFLSMSPDGTKIIFQYSAAGVPLAWDSNPTVQLARHNLPLLPVPVLFDTRTRRTSLAFKMVYIYGAPVWSRDSDTYFLSSPSPVGSRWEVADLQSRPGSTGDVNLFSVDVASGVVKQVVKHPPSPREGPMFVMPNGDVIVKAVGDAVVYLHESAEGWIESKRIILPGDSADRFYKVVSDGRIIVGVHETVTIPDELFRYTAGETQIHLLTNLNAEYASLHTASVQTIHWTTVSGLEVAGLLFVPPGFTPGKRYPLVIQTKPTSGWFSCDFGQYHEPSFAPQPMATAGIMYLARYLDQNYSDAADLHSRPSGYPGGISEAVQQMEIWESAIDSLSSRGMIDDSKVGIIGFSRTGWQVEFDLVHSRHHFAAATAADNVQFSLSEYWLLPWISAPEEQLYGGPPYGHTLDAWKKYSISFNLDKVHTPLLMEEMGYGVHDELSSHQPALLATYLEVAAGLRRLSKPVEMYFYPEDVHQLDHPRALEATMQRNVDWYRFWLQGYERAMPGDVGQYSRWKHLKEQRDTDVTKPWK